MRHGDLNDGAQYRTLTITPEVPTIEYTTNNGVPITSGLRVFVNDWVWGTVEPKQFEPGGRVEQPHFDGWFNVAIDPDQKWASGTKIYNGERMTTVKPS